MKQIKIIKTHSYEIIFLFILITGLILRAYEITQPYGKLWEGGYQEIIARNHVIYGFLNTKFLIVMSVINDHFIYRFNHPPLFQVILALSFKVFGIHEWSARIIPISFSMGSMALIYLVVSNLWNKKIAITSTFFATFIPMSVYFGRIVAFGPAVLFFGLLVLYGYLKLMQERKLKYKIFMIIGTIFGSLIDWPFLLLLPLLFFNSIVIGKNRRITLFMLFLGYIIILTYFIINLKITGNIELFSRIESRSELSNYLFDNNFYSVVFNRLIDWYTIPVLFLSAIWTVSLINRMKKRNISRSGIKRELIIILLLMWGILYIFLLPQSTFVHTYQIFYLIPGLSISAALGLQLVENLNLFNKSVGKIIASILILFFIVSSLSYTFTIHDTFTNRLHEIGILTNDLTDQDDLIAVDSPVIAYYSDRHFIGIPAGDAKPISLLKGYKPKIVEFQKALVDRSYVEFLKNENYELKYDDGRWEVWELNEYIVYNFINNFKSADVIIRNENLTKYPNKEYVTKYLRLIPMNVNEDRKRSIFEHPDGNGETWLSFNNISIPNNAFLNFSIALSPAVWAPEKGDGVLFEVYITKGIKTHIIFSKYIDPKGNPSDRKWHDFEILLDEYEGKDVTINFVTSAGPGNNNAYDGAGWGNPRITTKR